MGSICKRLQMLPFFDRMKESYFLILFVGCVLLRLFKILAGRVHIGFNFPKLLRILPDGFELGIGFGMLLFQSGIRMKNHGYPSLYDLHIIISILTNESQYENADIFPIF